MIEQVISGGQTGVDQAGWRAAKACGLPTGGWMPKGFLTEDGRHPEFAELYGAQEHPSPKYPPRTEANARDSDGTIWLGTGDSLGFACTVEACRKAGDLVKGSKPFFGLTDRNVRPSEVAAWIEKFQIWTLNVAGNRESKAPGIGARAEAFLTRVFRLLKEAPP